MKIPESETRKTYSLIDRLFKGELTPAEETRLADREVARGFLQESKRLGISPSRLFAILNSSGNNAAFETAREIVSAYYYNETNDKKGVLRANPRAFAGIFTRIYEGALSTLAIEEPIDAVIRRDNPEEVRGFLRCRYNAFYKEGIALPEDASFDDKREVLAKYFRKFRKKAYGQVKGKQCVWEIPDDKLGRLFQHMMDYASKRLLR